MKQFFEHIKKSIYGPVYYRELLTKPFSFSFKYYSALSLVVAMLLTVVSSIPLVPGILVATREFPPAFFAYYPDELEVRIDKGIVSTNVAEPYFLPLPAALKSEMGFDSGTESFAVIDTQTPFSMEQWRAYKTAAWIGRDQVALSDGKSGVRVESFGAKTDFAVSETALRRFEEKLQPFYKFLAPIIILAVFLGILIALAVNLLYLIFGAALIFLLGRLMKQHWSYRMSYRIGLHAITLPLLIKTFFSATSPKLFDIAFLFSAIMLGIVYANFKETTPAPPAPVTAPSTTPPEKA